MTAGQLGRRRIHPARQFAIGNDRSGKGDRTDEDAQEQLDLQNVDLDRFFLGDKLPEGAQLLDRAVSDCRRHIANLEVRHKADENRRQTHQRVHGSDQFRHLRHLHLGRQLIPDGPACRDQHKGQQPIARPRSDQRGKDRQRHAGNAVPHRALGAFLSRQTAKAEDEEDGCDHIGRCRKSKIHCLSPFKISGTWRAYAVSQGSRRRC